MDIRFVLYVEGKVAACISGGRFLDVSDIQLGVVDIQDRARSLEVEERVHDVRDNRLVRDVHECGTADFGAVRSITDGECGAVQIQSRFGIEVRAVFANDVHHSTDHVSAASVAVSGERTALGSVDVDQRAFFDVQSFGNDFSVDIQRDQVIRSLRGSVGVQFYLFAGFRASGLPVFLSRANLATVVLLVAFEGDGVVGINRCFIGNAVLEG